MAYPSPVGVASTVRTAILNQRAALDALLTHARTGSGMGA